jgi:hypothetical protein
LIQPNPISGIQTPTTSGAAFSNSISCIIVSKKRVLRELFTIFDHSNNVNVPHNTGNINNAKKEKRITGGIPEEEPGKVENQAIAKG